jgi:Arc/MetJ-type ribon-helix-helix transcriptional regulator
MTLMVPKDIEALVLARVEAGGFASAEEVLREAMKSWVDAEAARQADLAQIRAKIAEGDADQADVTPGQVRARLDTLAAKLAGRGADGA